MVRLKTLAAAESHCIGNTTPVTFSTHLYDVQQKKNPGPIKLLCQRVFPPQNVQLFLILKTSI